MHKKLIALILAFILLSSLALPGSAAVPDGLLASDASLSLSEEKAYCNATLEDEFADDRVVVVLSNKASTSLRTYTTADFEGIGCTKVQNLTQHTTELVNAKLRGETAELQKTAEPDVITFAEFKEVNTKTFRQILCLTLDKADKQNVLDVIDILMKHPDVISAEPDYVIRAAATTPNDPYRTEQWAIDKIQLRNAWDYTTGSSTIRVGVVDSGIDGTHPELSNKINVSLSRDFTGGNVATVSTVTDSNSHGTHVAGIIGAATNNSVGVSGTCYNVELVSLQVLDSSGDGTITSVYQAVDYARSQSIPILNMSLCWLVTEENQSMNTIANSVFTSYNGLIVCAASNYDRTGYVAIDLDNTFDNIVVLPAGYALPNLIVVGASTESDSRCVFSNYGASSVDLFAPGENILSCYPLDKCNFLLHRYEEEYEYHRSDGYHYMGGTSMAAPFVTGVVALIKARYPALTVAQVKDRIMESVDNTTTHHCYGCICGITQYKELHNYEQIGPRRYCCTICGYESDYLP